jgi:hypothetical protein
MNTITNNLTKEQKFAIYWCFNNAMKYMEIDEYDSDKEIVVNGININKTISELLQDRLFV